MSVHNLSNNTTLNQYQENSLEKIPLIPRVFSHHVPKPFRPLYNLLIFLSSKEGYAFPTDAYLSKKLKKPVRTIQHQLRRLKNLGFIHINSWSITRLKGKKRSIITRESSQAYLHSDRLHRIKKDEVRYKFYAFLDSQPTLKNRKKSKMLRVYTQGNVAGVSNNTNVLLEEKDNEKEGKGAASLKWQDIEKELVKSKQNVHKGKELFESEPKHWLSRDNPVAAMIAALKGGYADDRIKRARDKRETEQRGKEEAREKAHEQEVGRAISAIAKGQPEKFEVVDIYEYHALILPKGETRFRSFEFNKKGNERLKKFLTHHKVNLPKEIL